jgi:tetratricopeptide (TPR) repeat protein
MVIAKGKNAKCVTIMRHATRTIVIAVSIWLFSCAGSEAKPQLASSPPMPPREARAYLAEVQKQRGVRPAQHLPVMSMDELVSIMNNDDVARFEEAAQYVEGKPGVDALTVHATIELAWSDAYSTVAALAEEYGKRARSEELRLERRRDAGQIFTSAEIRALEEAAGEAATLTKARTALRVLAEDHLRAASIPVSESMRQFERDPRTHRVAAYSHLLMGEWTEYDKAMAAFEGQRGDAGIQYLRAMEALFRYGIPKDARDHLQLALEINPRLVRAQAKLVLAEEGIEEVNAELQKLTAMAPSHIVVNVAGPSIKREYEFSKSLARARDMQSAP